MSILLLTSLPPDSPLLLFLRTLLAGDALAPILVPPNPRESVSLARRLFQEGNLRGVLALGDDSLLPRAEVIFRLFPFGFPKLLVRTSSTPTAVPGLGDVQVLGAAVDLTNLNTLSRAVLERATLMLRALVENPLSKPGADEPPLVAVSMDERTREAAGLACDLLRQAGFSVLIFDASGVGGRSLEMFVLGGLLAGVLDLTTAELAATLLGGDRSAGVDRLTACALKGIPQVIVPGGLDAVWFGPGRALPEALAARARLEVQTGRWVRTSREENDELGREIGHKASAARGPVAVLVPLKGFSTWDREGGPFWDPEASRTLARSLGNWLGPNVELREREAHLADPNFVAEAVAWLVGKVGPRPTPGPGPG